MNYFFGYFGGKTKVAGALASLIEKAQHQCYCEPFMGGARVFFAMKNPVKCEVLNDINGELVNLFRVVKHHKNALMEEFVWGLNARAEFVHLQQTPPETLTDIQRAHRFFYLQKTSFGGGAKTYGYDTKQRARLDPTRFDAHLEKVQKRLRSVNVEHLPWQNAIERYDRPHTLFYLDPPYHGHEDVYGKGIFAERDFAEIAHTLARIKGQFVLSLNDTPQVRHWFKAFIPYKIETAYLSGTKHRGTVLKKQELIFSNLPAEHLSVLMAA